jgi:hypothetical protein
MHTVEIADGDCRRSRNRARKTAKNPHLMPEKMWNYNDLWTAPLVRDTGNSGRPSTFPGEIC